MGESDGGFSKKEEVTEWTIAPREMKVLRGEESPDTLLLVLYFMYTR